MCACSEHLKLANVRHSSAAGGVSLIKMNGGAYQLKPPKQRLSRQVCTNACFFAVWCVCMCMSKEVLLLKVTR